MIGMSEANQFHQYIIGTSVVLFATYLYSTPGPGARKPPPIIIADYEKTTIGGDPGYFDPKTPGKGGISPKIEARTSSRPTTPTIERHPHSRLTSSERNILSKRED
jgi:solute carrier family 35 (UDP-sugar transporter), member A1/2/3